MTPSKMTSVQLSYMSTVEALASYLSKTTAEKLASANTTSPVLMSLVALRPLPLIPSSNSSAFSMFPTVMVEESQQRRRQAAEGQAA